MIYKAARIRLSTKFQVNTCKTKKDRSAHAHLVVEIQAMIYNAARVKKLSMKFQVDTCKTTKDRSAHAQLRTLLLRGSGGYLQNVKSIHAELNKIYLRMRSYAPCS